MIISRLIKTKAPPDTNFASSFYHCPLIDRQIWIIIHFFFIVQQEDDRSKKLSRTLTGSFDNVEHFDGRPSAWYHRILPTLNGIWLNYLNITLLVPECGSRVKSFQSKQDRVRTWTEELVRDFKVNSMSEQQPGPCSDRMTLIRGSISF